MSNKAVTWAFKITGLKSSDKFVLVALADCADAADQAWPSVKGISEMTCMDRKTVIKSLDNLESNGLICDTGLRRGATGQVKIYQLQLDKTVVDVIPNSPQKGTVMDDSNSPANGTVKESQKRNSSKNGTVPDFPSKSTKFPTKESQISHERVPNLGHGTINEPSMNHKGTISRARGTRLPPDWIPSTTDVIFCQQARPDLDVNETASSFRDYWTSKAGKDACKIDWSATWRNWVRNEKPRRHTNQARRSADDVIAKAIMLTGGSPYAGIPEA